MCACSQISAKIYYLQIFEGERKLALENRFLGKLLVEGFSSGKVGTTKIVETMKLDRNGILHFTASVGDVCAELNIDYRTLQSNSIDEVIESANAHREADMREYDRLNRKGDLRRELERLQYAIDNVTFANF